MLLCNRLVASSDEDSGGKNTENELASLLSSKLVPFLKTGTEAKRALAFL